MSKLKGFTAQQSEALSEELAEIVDHQLATTSDLKAVETTLTSDLRDVEKTLKHEIKDVEKSLRNEMQSGFKELEYKLTIKLGGLMVTGVALLAALDLLVK